MTDALATCTGLAMAVATASTAVDVVDAIPTLSGTALLVWITIWQGKEINKLRERNRTLSDKCKNCPLAQTANEMLKDAGHDRITDEDESSN